MELQPVAHQAPLSLGFSRQEYWSGLPFLSPGDLPDPEIKSTSPTLQAGSLPLSHLGSPMLHQVDPTSKEKKAMAPHSSTLAWKISRTEEPGGLQSMGSLRVDTTARLHLHFSFSCIGEGNGNPLQRSCLENPKDGGAWWAAVYGVEQSRTRLQRLRSSSSSSISHDVLCI